VRAKQYAHQLSTLLLLHIGSHSKIVENQQEEDGETRAFLVYKYKEMGLSLVSGMLAGAILYYTMERRSRKA